MKIILIPKTILHYQQVSFVKRKLEEIIYKIDNFENRIDSILTNFSTRDVLFNSVFDSMVISGKYIYFKMDIQENRIFLYSKNKIVEDILIINESKMSFKEFIILEKYKILSDMKRSTSSKIYIDENYNIRYR